MVGLAVVCASRTQRQRARDKGKLPACYCTGLLPSDSVAANEQIHATSPLGLAYREARRIRLGLQPTQISYCRLGASRWHGTLIGSSTSRRAVQSGIYERLRRYLGILTAEDLSGRGLRCHGRFRSQFRDHSRS